jgi:hypothetical protein
LVKSTGCSDMRSRAPGSSLLPSGRKGEIQEPLASSVISSNILARGGSSRLGLGLDPWIAGAHPRPSAGERRQEASASISTTAATHLGMLRCLSELRLEREVGGRHSAEAVLFHCYLLLVVCPWWCVTVFMSQCIVSFLSEKTRSGTSQTLVCSFARPAVHALAQVPEPQQSYSLSSQKTTDGSCAILRS